MSYSEEATGVTWQHPATNDEPLLTPRLELVPVIADDAASAMVATRVGLRPTGEYRWHEGIREQLWRRRLERPPDATAGHDRLP